jgi:ATP-binding cassette subfamily B protein
MQAGDVLGIVGPPGSGKTTLLNLIPRFFEVQQGCIRIGGTDIGKIRLDRLRHMIAYLSQEPFLFNGTVRDNILLWSRDKPAGEMTDAAKAAAAYETIMGFPAGFDTLVGEKGVILSGGQKQRIALARCFLQDTPILLLDDPISQVDTETGAAIIANLQSMLGTKTMVITSHRMAVLRLASHIIVLDKGRVIESGHHDALMNQDGYYARTYRLQALEEEFNAGMAPGRRSP